MYNNNIYRYTYIYIGIVVLVGYGVHKTNSFNNKYKILLWEQGDGGYLCI